MNTIRSFLGFSILLTLTACTTPHMQVAEDLLDGGSRYPVEGRQGWLINQQLRMGEFLTSPVQRGWTKGYDYPFIVRFSGAKEKLSFSIQDESGLAADLFCLGKLSEKDLLVLHKYFDINLQTKDAFTCTIGLGPDSIDFWVTNLNQDNTFRKVSGAIRGKNLEISIEPVTRLDTGQRMLDTRVPGLNFMEDGRAIAAVETLNQGVFWMLNGLGQEQKLVLAGAAAAILLRSDLAEHND